MHIHIHRHVYKNKRNTHTTWLWRRRCEKRKKKLVREKKTEDRHSSEYLCTVLVKLNVISTAGCKLFELLFGFMWFFPILMYRRFGLFFVFSLSISMVFWFFHTWEIFPHSLTHSFTRTHSLFVKHNIDVNIGFSFCCFFFFLVPLTDILAIYHGTIFTKLSFFRACFVYYLSMGIWMCLCWSLFLAYKFMYKLIFDWFTHIEAQKKTKEIYHF